MKTASKSYLIGILAIFLSGCATSEKINLPNGEIGHKVTCTFTGDPRPSACIEKAGKTCGSKGYTTLQTGSGYQIIQCGANSSDNTNTSSNQDAAAELSPRDFFSQLDFPLNEKYLLQVSNHQNCALWDTASIKATKVTWSGQCENGFTTGFGKAIFDYPINGKIIISTSSGAYQNGKVHGRWVESSEIGKSSGHFNNGEYIGKWIVESADDTIFLIPYENNQIHGTLKIQLPDGELLNLEFVDGVLQE